MDTITETLEALTLLTERRMTRAELAAYGIQPTVNAQGVKRQKARVGGSPRRRGGGPQVGQKLKRDLRSKLPQKLQDEFDKFMREQERKPDFASLSFNQLSNMASQITWDVIKSRLEAREAGGSMSDQLDLALVQATRSLLKLKPVASASMIKRIAMKNIGADLSAAGRSQPDADEVKSRLIDLERRGFLKIGEGGVTEVTDKRKTETAGRSFAKSGEELVTPELASFFVSPQSEGGLALRQGEEFLTAAIFKFIDELPSRHKDYRDLADEVEGLTAWVDREDFDSELKDLRTLRSTQKREADKLKIRADRLKKKAADAQRKAPKNPKTAAGAKKVEAADKVMVDYLAVKKNLDSATVAWKKTAKQIADMEASKKRLKEAVPELQALGQKYVDEVEPFLIKAGTNLANLVDKLEDVRDGKKKNYTIEQLKDDAFTFWTAWKEFFGKAGGSEAAQPFRGRSVRGRNVGPSPLNR